jgi:Cu-Zn family superoxide dismutase
MRRLGLVLALLLLGGSVASAQRTTREAPLRDAAGKEVGRASVRDSAGIMLFLITANGLPAGTHGVHLHEAGNCEAPDFETAGPHYNPHQREHGRKNPKGPHLGDLGNITVESNGRGTRNVSVNDRETRRGLAAFLDLGRSIVVHASADDDLTDPAGNSGARIACAVLK